MPRAVSLEPGAVYRVTVPWSDSGPTVIETVGPLPPPGAVVVNEASAPGWLYGSGADYTEYYGSDVYYWNGGAGKGPAAWSSPTLPAGTYRVSAAWTPNANRAGNAQYTILSGPAVLASRALDQRAAPTDGWEPIATVSLAAPGALAVQLSGRADGWVIADAVRFEPVAAGPAPAFLITIDAAGLTADQQAAYRSAADRWQQVITGPPGTLAVSVNGAPWDGPGNGLAQSAPDRLAPGTYLPTHANSTFDTADGVDYLTALHELAHCLGFGSIWGYLGLVQNGTFVGPRAVAEYGGPVPLAPDEQHWSEGALGGELMTPTRGGAMNLSRLTAAGMADLGYTVNMGAV